MGPLHVNLMSFD